MKEEPDKRRNKYHEIKRDGWEDVLAWDQDQDPQIKEQLKLNESLLFYNIIII